MNGVFLTINGIQKKATDITYEDLVVLYSDFTNKYGRPPAHKDCLSKNNLPQGRIVTKLLKENNVSYKDFMNMFGKVSKVRTEDIDNYDKYVEKFILVCKELNRTLASNELINNNYGLPGDLWFIRYCPDKNVKTYRQFIDYCGLEQTKHIWTKDEVSKILIDYEKKVNRPIVGNDIQTGNIGFSMIVIHRLYGSLRKAKMEIGLMETLPVQPKSAEYYKNALKTVVENYKQETNSKYITWNDIESGLYGYDINHKTYQYAFNRLGEDIDVFLFNLGCMMNKSGTSYTQTFYDGERVGSSLEYRVSEYLRSLGLEYNKDYTRSVKYKTFSNEKSNIDCDYCIDIGGEKLYIEVAGIINNCLGNWKTKKFSTKIEQEYQKKMIYKEKVFVENGKHFLFLFPEDIKNNTYKDLIKSNISVA